MTFTLPQDLAAEFLRRIPASSRSHYVAAHIRARLRDREEQLIRACEVANSNADALDIETSFDNLADELDQARFLQVW